MKTRRKGRWLTGLLSALAAVGLMVALTWGHWWRKVRNVEIENGGIPSPNSIAYWSTSGDILLRLQGSRDDDLYFIFPAGGKVGKPNISEVVFLPGLAYSRHSPPQVVYLGTAKAEEQPDIIIRGDSVEFTSSEKTRVRIKW